MRRWLLCVLLSLTFFQLADTKGSFGGGRGSSGARSSSSFSSSSSRSSSSSFGGSSSSSRPTYTSSSSSYRSGNTQYSSNFRQNVFHTTTTSTTFMYSPMTHTHVILNPITPIYFGSYHYYWGGHYVQNYERPQKCEYEISDDDQELRNVTFSNGTRPTTLSFGCRSSESCCGLECCGGGSTWVWIVVLIVVIALCICACSWCQKNGHCNCQPTETFVTAVPVVTTTTTTHSYSVPSAPPPPPGFQPQFVPEGQPVYAPPPAYNTYEQPSPYGLRPVSSSQVHAHYKC